MASSRAGEQGSEPVFRECFKNDELYASLETAVALDVRIWHAEYVECQVQMRVTRMKGEGSIQGGAHMALAPGGPYQAIRTVGFALGITEQLCHILLLRHYDER